MKKMISILVLILFMFSLSACGSSDDSNQYIPSYANVIETTTAVTYVTENISVPSTTLLPIINNNDNAKYPTTANTITTQPFINTTNHITTSLSYYTATSCSHAFSAATCTTPKTCTKCGTIEGNATGHTWGNPTCITPRSCIICFEVDPNSEPIGHSFDQGVCRICGDNDTDYTPVLTASKTNVNLSNANESDVIYFTIPNGYTIVYNIDNTNIVNCKWGDWNGDTTSLTFYPVSSGETYVTVSVEGYDVSVVIKVSVKIQYSTLTIVGVGEKYTTYYTGLSEAWCFLHSAEYKQTDHPNDDSVYFDIEVISEFLGDNCYGNDKYGICYELYRDDVCVQSGNVLFDARYYNQKTASTFNYFGKAGNYILKFKDLYT